LTWIFAYVSGVDIAKFNTIRHGTGDVHNVAEFRALHMQLPLDSFDVLGARRRR
jgi:hypothetical protein